MPQEDLSCRSMTRVYMRIVFILRGLTFSSQFFRDMQEAVIKKDTIHGHILASDP
jgi:hypothetical protein